VALQAPKRPQQPTTPEESLGHRLVPSLCFQEEYIALLQSSRLKYSLQLLVLLRPTPNLAHEVKAKPDVMIRKTTAIAIDDRVVKAEDDYADSRQNGCCLRRGPHKEDGNEENQKADCEYRQHA
jgi:hypothetical protein